MGEEAIQDPVEETGEATEEIKETPETGEPGAPAPEEAPKPETAETTGKETEQDELRKAQARAAWAERELKRQQRAAASQPQPPERAKDLGPEPKVEDFTDYNDYVKATQAWTYKTERAKERQEEAKQEIQRKSAERRGKIDSIVATETAKDPQFTKKAFLPAGPLEDLLIDSPELVNIALYFGGHIDEAVKLHELAGTNPIQAAREIGRLETRLANKTPQPRTTTKAPAPTKPVDGGPAGLQKDPAKMTMAEYKAWRDAGGGKT